MTDLFWLIVADRGLVLIAGEDAHRHRLSAGCHVRQHVCHLVETPQDVIELETVELVLQLRTSRQYAAILALWQLDSFMT